MHMSNCKAFATTDTYRDLKNTMIVTRIITRGCNHSDKG